MSDRYDSGDAALERDLVNEEPPVEDDEDEEFFVDDDPFDDDWDYDDERGVWW
jgi:hypothetical protein